MNEPTNVGCTCSPYIYVFGFFRSSGPKPKGNNSSKVIVFIPSDADMSYLDPSMIIVVSSDKNSRRTCLQSPHGAVGVATSLLMLSARQKRLSAREEVRTW